MKSLTAAFVVLALAATPGATVISSAHAQGHGGGGPGGGGPGGGGGGPHGGGGGWGGGHGGPGGPGRGGGGWGGGGWRGGGWGGGWGAAGLPRLIPIMVMAMVMDILFTVIRDITVIRTVGMLVAGVGAAGKGPVITGRVLVMDCPGPCFDFMQAVTQHGLRAPPSPERGGAIRPESRSYTPTVAA